MEHAIGTRITLEVVENKNQLSCEGCFFYEMMACPPSAKGRCISLFRTDHKDIVYKEIKRIDMTLTKDQAARNAASTWCRCYKCDGIINGTGSKCQKEKLITCRKWYDGYRTALLVLTTDRGEIL